MLTLETVLRVLALCLALAATETLHGIARTKYLNPALGKARAIKLSVVTGTVLAFLVCYLLVPGLALRSYAAHVVLGLTLALFMATFDVTLGRLLLKRPWRTLAQDFNPASGNYLIFGLVALIMIPSAVFYLRGPAH
jgi:hypothetical protein